MLASIWTEAGILNVQLLPALCHRRHQRHSDFAALVRRHVLGTMGIRRPAVPTRCRQDRHCPHGGCNRRKQTACWSAVVRPATRKSRSKLFVTSPHCPICGGRVSATKGRLEFFGKIVGRCEEAPVEHVFFRSITLRGTESASGDCSLAAKVSARSRVMHDYSQYQELSWSYRHNINGI